MKKFLSLSLLLLFSLVFAQEQKEINTEYEGGIENSLFRKNEIRLNALSLIFTGIGGAYERILNDDIGVGVSFLKTYHRDDFTLNYYISPYARYYFGKKPAAGFFFEGFGAIINYDYYKYYDYYNVNDTKKLKSKTSYALGFSIGNKWVKRSGFTVETMLGIGRSFNQYKNEGDFMYKLGISLGYRF